MIINYIHKNIKIYKSNTKISKKKKNKEMNI
jgi:hypothetical protein